MSALNPSMSWKLATGSVLAAAAVVGASVVPASASPAEPLDHACSLGGNAIGNVAITHDVPETVIYGGTVEVLSTFTLPDGVRDAMYGGTVRSLEGPTTTTFKIFGTVSPLEGSVPTTAVTATDPLALAVTSSVTLPDAAPVGLALGFTAGDGTTAPDLTGTLALSNEGGAKLADTPLECSLVAAGDPEAGTVTIIKAGTQTVASAVAKTTKRVNASAVVTSPSSVQPAGDVRLLLKRDGKTVDSTVVTLENGKAKAGFATTKSGAYKVVASYLGDEHFTGSRGVARAES